MAVGEETILVGLVDRDGNPGLYLLSEDGLLVMASAPPGIMEAPLDRTGREKLMALAGRAAAAGQWRDGGEISGSALSSGWPTERASLLSMRYFSKGWWGRDLDLMKAASAPMDKVRSNRPPPKREAEVSLVLSKTKPGGILSVRYAGIMEVRAPQPVRDAWENKELFLEPPASLSQAAKPFVQNLSPDDGLTEDPNWKKMLPHFPEAVQMAAAAVSNLSAWLPSRPHGTDVVLETVLGRVPLQLAGMSRPAFVQAS